MEFISISILHMPRSFWLVHWPLSPIPVRCPTVANKVISHDVLNSRKLAWQELDVVNVGTIPAVDSLLLVHKNQIPEVLFGSGIVFNS